MYDYVGSKDDWQSAGLPMEPSIHNDRYAAGVADTNVCRCRLSDSIADVAQRVHGDGWQWCVVVDDHDVVFGLVSARDLDESDSRRIDAVMEEGPQTVRPDTTVDDVAERMQTSDLDQVIVTDPDGRLLGVLPRSRVQAPSVHSRA